MWKEVAVIGWVFHLQLSWHCGLEVDEAKSALEMISYQGNPILRAKIYADDHSVHCTVKQDARTTSTLATFITRILMTASLWYSPSAIGEAMSSYEYQAYRVHFNTSGMWIQCIVIHPCTPWIVFPHIPEKTWEMRPSRVSQMIAASFCLPPGLALCMEQPAPGGGWGAKAPPRHCHVADSRWGVRRFGKSVGADPSIDGDWMAWHGRMANRCIGRISCHFSGSAQPKNTNDFGIPPSGAPVFSNLLCIWKPGELPFTNKRVHMTGCLQV